MKDGTPSVVELNSSTVKGPELSQYDIQHCKTECCFRAQQIWTRAEGRNNSHAPVYDLLSANAVDKDLVCMLIIIHPYLLDKSHQIK